MNVEIRVITDVKDVENITIPESYLKFGHTQLVQKNDDLYIVVGMKKDNISLEDLRFLGGTTRKALPESTGDVEINYESIISKCSGIAEREVVTAFMEGWFLAGYQFTAYQKKKANQEITVQIKSDTYQQYANEAKTRAEAVNIARDLCNEPANKLTPAIYAERLKQLFNGTDVEVEIIETEELLEKGFEAIHTVGKGSTNPPKLAVLTLKRGKGKHIALVGKGVTFDSGGTNIKTGRFLADMKMDMGGSAAVVGAMKLLADTASDVHVTAVLPLVENISGGNAFLPSDVITYKNGLTVEVGNTDAEGRLVLADGILHAQELGAETIIDIATLTGAIVRSLGERLAGIFSNREEELWEYKKLGERTGDLVWPMPTVEEYESLLKSETADFSNVSSSALGGSITAALFLKKFVEEERKWIHIDMASTMKPWKEEGYYVAGASGFGVRLLTELVLKETN